MSELFKHLVMSTIHFLDNDMLPSEYLGRELFRNFLPVPDHYLMKV